MKLNFKQVNKQGFSQVFDVIEKSFPLSEYRPYEKQLECMEFLAFQPMIIECENELIGILIQWQFDDFIYLEHLAVNPEKRSSGLGSKLMKEYMSVTHKPIVLEVEEPLTELAHRRINFYNRLGFHTTSMMYKQPSFTENDDTVNLIMMTHPILSNDQLIKIKDELLEKVYFVK